MNKYLLIGGVALVAIGGAAYYYNNTSNTEPSSAVHAQGGVQAVSVLTVEKKKISLTKSLPGRISAFKQSQVRPQVNGIITERFFEEGANVEKGQQLYQIDDARYKAALASAEADLRSASSTISSLKSKTDRYKDLVKINAVSLQEYDDVQAQLDQANATVGVAKAAVDVAKINVEYTKVYAPISGRIGRSLVTEGALVTANQEQAMSVITQLDPIYVDMQQSSAEAMNLQQALLQGKDNIPVTVLLGERNEISYPHEGSLKFSEVTIDETTGSITLRATVPNPDNILMPGLFVRAKLLTGEKDAILVPQRATTRGPDGGLSVWVVGDDNKASPRKIEVSDAHEGNWIVNSGLNSGERVVIEGYQKISPGAEVKTTPWEQDSSGQK